MGFNVALWILFSITIILISNNSVILGQSEGMSGQMSAQQIGGVGVSIFSLSEWIGIFSIGIVVGLLAFKTNYSSNDAIVVRTRRIIISIAILSLSVGAIHLLLVQEHAKESIWWGVVFLIAGFAQIVFGMIIVFIKRPPANIIVYYIGNIGNALLIITFILVRLFTPPFSPEGTPINELQPNGIITLIIEIAIVVLLMYIIRSREVTKKIMK